MLKGISSFQIEGEIKKIYDKNLNSNFVGVFPADKMKTEKTEKAENLKTC